MNAGVAREPCVYSELLDMVKIGRLLRCRGGLVSDFLTIYLFCALGVAISVLLPVLRQSLPKTGAGAPAGVSGWLPRFWAAAKPYLALTLFSLFVALLLVAFIQDQLTDWRAAVLAGYASDSTLQKLRG